MIELDCRCDRAFSQLHAAPSHPQPSIPPRPENGQADAPRRVGHGTSPDSAFIEALAATTCHGMYGSESSIVALKMLGTKNHSGQNDLHV